MDDIIWLMEIIVVRFLTNLLTDVAV